MDFRYTTEQEMYRQAIREWLVKNLEPRARAIDEAEDGIPDDITAGMAEMGMFGVTIPEEYGGMPLPDEERLIYAMITIQEIARADLSMSTPVYTLLTIGWSYIIDRYGTDELNQEVLPAAAAGKTFVGINTTYKDMGRMGLSTGGWIYKDVELPRKYIIGEEGKGFYVNMDGFNAARVLV